MSGQQDLSPLAFNSSYDPTKGLISYTSLYGSGTTVTFEELQIFVNKKITQGILFGTRIGAAGLAIIVLWMVSKNRKTPIFIINQISLFLILLHSGLFLRYLLGDYASVVFNFTLFSQSISRNDVHVYGATNMIQVLLVAAVEISLIFQVRVIFKGDSYKGVGRILTSISAVLGFTTVVMYFITAVKSMASVYSDVTKTSDRYFFNIASILLSSSVNFMTLLLTVKLILAIRSRRFLGLKQFDSFHVLLIMSFQTLIFPSILFILAYALNPNQGTDTLTSIATLLVTLSLPLSSMWATSANNSSHPSSINTQFRQRNYDEVSFKTGITSFYSESSKSSSKYRHTNKLYDLYPVSRTSNSRCNGYPDDGSKLAPNPNCVAHNDSAMSVNDKNRARDTCVQNNVTLNTDSTLNYSNVDTQDTSKNFDDQFELYTPNTAADEEAKKFWSESQSTSTRKLDDN